MDQTLPEPMNASPHHTKVKITTKLADTLFVAGTYVSGKIEMECRADRGLGISVIMVELFGLQELSSRDHSATSTFLHSHRLFQGPGLPPSNAVQAHPMPGDPPLPRDYYQARRGKSTFLFRIPLPATSPSSIVFGSGLAKVRYELRASVGVLYKNARRVVVDKHTVEVVDSYPFDEMFMGKMPESIVVGEGGKLWMQGTVVGPILVGGESACLELQVKNHSSKKNTGLTLSLKRTLYLPGSATGSQRPAPVQISDTLITVPYRGPEYIILPGVEGVANLVFDVPRSARAVRGGTLDGDVTEGEKTGPRHTESLFEIRCKVEVKLTMGMGSKDIVLEIPVELAHPKAVPTQPVQNPYQPGVPYLAPQPPEGIPTAPYHQDHAPYYPIGPTTPGHLPFIDPAHNQVWLPPPPLPIPVAQGYPYPSNSPVHAEAYPYPPQPHFSLTQPFYASHTPPHSVNLVAPQQTGYIQRPLSAGPISAASQVPPSIIPGLPPPSLHPSINLLPLPYDVHAPHDAVPATYVPEEGKGERAFRVSQHLRQSSRARSVSPPSHRYPILESPNQPVIIPPQPPQLPVPPLLLPKNDIENDSFSFSPLSHDENVPVHLTGGVLHSPRPQLTPKHSFTRDSVLGATLRSERVEELEKMADVVALRSEDLSADLPKGTDEVIAALKLAEDKSEHEGAKETGKGKEKEKGTQMIEPSVELTSSDLRKSFAQAVSGVSISLAETNINKTLPGPPVPTSKQRSLLSPSTPSSRPRADLYFNKGRTADDDFKLVQETSPLPKDQTPPTPALLAVRQPYHELRTESGLDALERRLLAEVGTRKIVKEPRADSRSILISGGGAGGGAAGSSLPPIDTEAAQREGKSAAIAIPAKSPEPLNDSAISSLTLAGRMAMDDDSDGDFDGRTHKAGQSRGGSVSGGDDMGGILGGGLHMHMRQRAEVSTPTKSHLKEKEKEGERESDGKKARAKEGKISGKKERTGEKSRSKTNAKGRVAAWLGEIDPGVPPQEQIIPPSPSVMQGPLADFASLEEDTDELFIPLPGARSKTPTAPVAPSEDVSAAPNPRSSGFVPIATLKRETITAKPLNIARDATVVEEARRVQDIWSSEVATPVLQDKPPPRFALAFSPPPKTQTIRTDRKVSPPSSRPTPSEGFAKPTTPMSYSAAARNVWKLPNPPVKAPVVTPPSPNKTPVPPPKPTSKLPVFPPPSNSTAEQPKYDIRSARGGRGGKVTTVASLWASGAIANQIGGLESKSNDAPKRLSVVEENGLPDRPLPAEKPTSADKKLFSAALKQPAPKRVPVPTSSAQPPVAKWAEAQKRPDSRDLFSKLKAASPAPQKTLTSAVDHAAHKVTYSASSSKASHSTEALSRPRPGSVSPFAAYGKVTPATHSTPSSFDVYPNSNAIPKRLAPTKGIKPPVVKGTSDPAVISSSHATPTLSSSASLARPASQKPSSNSRPVKLPAILSTPVLSSTTSSASDTRPVSPSKPADLAFGQARLRDLIKKYQGQGQKS